MVLAQAEGQQLFDRELHDDGIGVRQGRQEPVEMFREQRGQAQTCDLEQGELLRGAVVAAFEHLEESQQQGLVVGGFGHPQVRDGLLDPGLDLGTLIGDEVLAEGVRGGTGGDEVFLPAASRSGNSVVFRRPSRQEPGIVGNREVEGEDEFVDQFGVGFGSVAAFQQACDEVAGPVRTVAGQPGEQPVAGDGQPDQLPDVPGGEGRGALRGGGADGCCQQDQVSAPAVLPQTSTQGGEGLADRFADRRTVGPGEVVEGRDEVLERC